MNIREALELCRRENRAGHVITDKTLEQWNEERARLLVVIAQGREWARQLQLALVDHNLNECARLANKLCLLGLNNAQD